MGWLSGALAGTGIGMATGLGGLGTLGGAVYGGVTDKGGDDGKDSIDPYQVKQALTPEQMAQANSGITGALQGGTNYLDALKGQGGVALETGAADRQQQFLNAIAGAGGINNTQNASSILGGANAQMQGLAGLGQTGASNLQSAYNQMQGVASGQGPNPAQAALNQATSNNIQQQAALMAGQRGAGANAGLIARQAAMQGGNIQQQAAGQSATMQAQQQLAAMGQLAGIANNQLGAGQQQLRDIQGVGNSLGNLGINQAQLQQQGLGQYAAQTGHMVDRTLQAQQGNTGAYQNYYDTAGQQFNQGQQTQANVSTQSDIAQANIEAGDRSANKKMIGDSVGGIANAGGKMAAMNHGGMVPHYAVGGNVMPMAPVAVPMAPPMPVSEPMTQSSYSRMLSGESAMPIKKENYMSRGGSVPAMVSPGEGYIAPERVPAVSSGKVDPIQAAAKVPGKAKVKGDSLQNDTVSTNLEEGGIVLPRSVMESKHPHWAAHKFVQQVMSKQALKGK